MPTKFKTTQDWLDFDKSHLWHPYTSMKDPLPCYPVEKAEGVQKMSHVMFGGIAHQPASELGARLLDIAPDAFQHIFLADSGSISVEVAIKMALQYWQSSGQNKKQKMLTIRGGYHGDPFTCMSVSDPDNSNHAMFPSAIAKHIFTPRPNVAFNQKWEEHDVAVFAKTIEKQHHTIAAVIVEPIVQGAGGMRFYHPEYLRQVRALCDHYNVLLIFDEIATGFGRTGKMFACEHAGIIPDIMCVGKALTGGMMTLAATMATRDVAMTISSGDMPILMHGPTFMGNPLACAVASASLDILTNSGSGATYPQGWSANVKRIEHGLKALFEIMDHAAIADVRVLGAIGVVEMKAPVDVAALQKRFVEKGVWVRPFAHLIYIMPPYIISDDQLKKICSAIIETIDELY